MSTGIIAVADLGSNSFKLEIAQVKNGRPKIIERIRKNVKLGGGVGPCGTDRARGLAPVRKAAPWAVEG